jgi:CRISPR/Cas system CSM-associated protein Csm2 small subunit
MVEMKSSVVEQLTSRKLIEMVCDVMRNKKLTLKTVAAKLDMADSTLSYRINRDCFNLSEFLALCDVVGIDLMWRERGYDDPKKPSNKPSHRPVLGVVRDD